MLLSILTLFIKRQQVEEAENALMSVASFTNYYPQKWRKKAFRSEVKSDFESFFVYKVHAFVLEIISVVCAPLVLMVSLPPCAEQICEFVKINAVEVAGVGDIIGLSTFDLDKFGDSKKTEDSFLGFKRAHNKWQPTNIGGPELIDRIRNWKSLEEQTRQQILERERG